MYPAAVSSDAYGPLYSRIAMLMRQRIMAGQWAPQTQIPTIEALIEEFGASRVTIRLALDMLERDGLIERFRGRGTFVTDRADGLYRIRLGQKWRTLIETLEGTVPRLLETLEDTRPPGDEGLGECELAKSYTRLKRVHVRDNIPFAVMHIHLDRNLYERAADRFNHGLAIPVLQTLEGLKIGHAHQSLSIACAEPDVAAHLGVPIGVPVGMLRRVICDEDGVAVYVGDYTYRGDMIRMEVDLDLSEDGDD
jgi:GntR family transcriptional regulator